MNTCSYSVPRGYNDEEVDLFEDMIYEVFVAADTRKKGYLSQEQFVQLLQSESLGLALTDKDLNTIVQQTQGLVLRLFFLVFTIKQLLN